MKAKITKPDGTTIEIEGDADEVAEVLRAHVPVAEVPAYVPVPYPVPYTGTPWDHPRPYEWRCNTLEVSLAPNACDPCGMVHRGPCPGPARGVFGGGVS